MQEPQTDFIQVEVERERHLWYNDFTEHWTVSVAVDADNPSGDVRYSVRVVGPNGEVGKQTQLEPEDVDPDIRAKFEDIFRDAATVV